MLVTKCKYCKEIHEIVKKRLDNTKINYIICPVTNKILGTEQEVKIYKASENELKHFYTNKFSESAINLINDLCASKT